MAAELHVVQFKLPANQERLSRAKKLSGPRSSGPNQIPTTVGSHAVDVGLQSPAKADRNKGQVWEFIGQNQGICSHTKPQNP